MLGVIKEVKESSIFAASTNGKKIDDKNFEVFKEYNKALLSFPTEQDPYLTHKREQYRRLQGLNTQKNVFNRLTQTSSDDVTAPQIVKHKQLNNSVSASGVYMKTSFSTNKKDNNEKRRGSTLGPYSASSLAGSNKKFMAQRATSNEPHLNHSESQSSGSFLP